MVPVPVFRTSPGSNRTGFEPVLVWFRYWFQFYKTRIKKSSSVYSFSKGKKIPILVPV
jgi:hypothetical protein